MNCKPGDLAVIVNSPPDCIAARGRIVTLVEHCIIDGEGCWTYEQMPLRGRVPGMHLARWAWHELPDVWLRPITPPPGTVTTGEVRELYAPRTVTSTPCKHNTKEHA
jgi:hypothetical protein